ncbi:MAG: AAA family ATPase [Treponema sp.]|nr:AAA family ATPase [Candidatus Treponema scatequi]
MTINTKQLYYILDHTPESQNIMLIGKHGIGKSRILEDYFSERGAKVVTLFLGQMSDPGDLIGLPEKNEKTGKTDFMLPYWFPTDDKPIVLFLDELNRARPEVLQTIMDLTLNRKLAGKSLPKNSRIISAVNNGSEYQLTDLDPALVSRFNIYEFAPSVDDWLSWGEKSGIDPRVLSFIEQNPEYLDSDESLGEEGNLVRSPDRRSWERTSDVIKDIKSLDREVMPLVSGIIGNKAASLFFKSVNEANTISAKDVLTDFENIKSKLTSLAIPDFAFINKSIYKFLESQLNAAGIASDDGNDKSSVQTAGVSKSVLSENLNKYFDWLGENQKSEIQTHFVSLVDGEKYAHALCFMKSECGELFDKMMKVIK